MESMLFLLALAEMFKRSPELKDSATAFINSEDTKNFIKQYETGQNKPVIEPVK